MLCLRRSLPCFTAFRRGVVVVERVHEPRRFPEGTSQELMDRLTREVALEKHQTYRVLKETDEPRSLRVLLTTSLEDFGPRGAVVSLPEDVARQKIILPGLGVYLSPNNLKKYADILLDTETFRLHSSESAQKTRATLSRTCLGIRMSGRSPWTLTPHHVSLAFLMAGFVVPPEAIFIPREIAGPNHQDLENKEFYVVVTINGFEKVKVRCVMKHTTIGIGSFDFDRGLQFKFWEPAFEEDREVLSKLPREPFTQKAKEMVELEEDYVKYEEWFDNKERELYRTRNT